jgi:hypothetical protein
MRSLPGRDTRGSLCRRPGPERTRAVSIVSEPEWAPNVIDRQRRIVRRCAREAAAAEGVASATITSNARFARLAVVAVTGI